DVLVSLSNFTCARCGKVFGPVDQLDDSFVLAVDGLTGLSKMAFDLHVGAKPAITQPEFGVIMGQIQRLIDKLTTSTKCSFVLTSHVDKEIDQINGGYVLTLDTIGNKLGPRIPKMFDECVYCYREDNKFYWSTSEQRASVKHRRLAYGDK